MKRRYVFLAFLTAAALASASDFGLALSVAPEYGNEDGFELTATAGPWFSALVGERDSVYLSANCQLDVEDGQAAFEFDVRRFQYHMVTSDGKRFDFGRFFVSDLSGTVVAGLLDGARAELSAGASSLRLGAYYTGLFNKDTNYLYMSAKDMADMADADRYFSASRILASAVFFRPGVFGGQSLSVEALGQFDLRADGDKLHSQYLEAGLSGPLSSRISYKAYAIASLVEKTDESAAFAGGFAADLSWLPQGGPDDKVYGQIRWGSGQGDSGGSAFVPVTANPQGNIFDSKLAGLLAARGGYSARFTEKISVDGSLCAYFKTGDAVSDPEVVYDSDSGWLGVEVFAFARVVPVSDAAFSLGAGVFLPNAGGTFVSDAAPRWLVTAVFLFSL